MAEFVQSRLEDLTPIMEEIRRLKLLSPAKIKEVIGNMQSHEYKIQKMTRDLGDVLDYVEYQLEVLSLIREAREETQIFIKTPEIDEKLQHRINSLFGVYQRNFHNDLNFWLARLNFCLGLKWYNLASTVFQDLTNFLGKDHPFLWQRASDFEWKRGPLKGIDVARRLMQLGIRGDNHNLELYVWTFELELKHAEFLTLEQKKMESSKKQSTINYDAEITKCFNAANVIFEEAKNNCWEKDCTVKLYVLFHSVTSNYPSSVGLNIPFLRHLEANCSSEEETYHVLAMIAFNKDDLETGRNKLEKGLKTVQTVKMYDIAVNDLFKWAETKPSKMVFKQLSSILNQGHNNDKLSVSCYVKWADLGVLWKDFTDQRNLEPSSKKRKHGSSVSPKGNESGEDHFTIKSTGDILNLGLKKYHNHPELIVAKAKLMVKKEEWIAEDIFHLVTLMGESYGTSNRCYEDFCSQIFMSFLLDPSRRTSLEKLVERVDDPSLKEKLTILYLKHMALVDGLQGAQEYFEKTSYLSSYKLQLTMAEIEFLHIDYECKSGDPCKNLRNIMENACTRFGKTIDPWVDFIRYERQLKNSDCANLLYSRALKVLPVNLHESFISAERSNAKKTYIVSK